MQASAGVLGTKGKGTGANYWGAVAGRQSVKS